MLLANSHNPGKQRWNRSFQTRLKLKALNPVSSKALTEKSCRHVNSVLALDALCNMLEHRILTEALKANIPEPYTYTHPSGLVKGNLPLKPSIHVEGLIDADAIEEDTLLRLPQEEG